jgi:hypothetical protein
MAIENGALQDGGTSTGSFLRVDFPNENSRVSRPELIRPNGACDHASGADNRPFANLNAFENNG